MKKKLFLSIILSLILSSCGSANSRDYIVAESSAFNGGNIAMAKMAVAPDVSYETNSSSTNGSLNINISGPNSRKLIYNCDVSTETKDFSSFLDSNYKFISNIGGYVQSSSQNSNSYYDGDNDSRYSYVVARVPYEKLEEYIEFLENNSNITYLNKNVSDITFEYTDVELKRSNLEEEQKKIQELLSKASDIDSIIKIEEKLSDIQYEMENLDAQLRRYNNDISYSTVSLNIQEVITLSTPVDINIFEKMKTGFFENIETVKNFCIKAIIWFVSSLPSIVLIVLVVIILYLFLRGLFKGKKGHSKGHSSEDILKDALKSDFKDDLNDDVINNDIRKSNFKDKDFLDDDLIITDDPVIKTSKRNRVDFTDSISLDD